MQISKVVTTVFTTVCASTAIASPAYGHDGGPSNDITAPPRGGNYGNGINNCGQDKLKGWEEACAQNDQFNLGGIVLSVLSVLNMNEQEKCHEKPDQILCCNNIGSGNQICINNNGEIDKRALRMA
ncbi:hypothetical protein ACLOAV_010810 [Pseudogymnoascus australis]